MIREDVGAELARLQPSGGLLNKDFFQLFVKVNLAPLGVLHLAGLEPHDALIQVDLRPDEGADLREPPSDPVRESNKAPQVLREDLPDGQEIPVFEETLTDVIFLIATKKRYSRIRP